MALRPETLRIAVGPPNSDDQKLIKALAQTFAQQRMAVRLAPIPTTGPAESLALLGADKTDLAVARGDLNMPADAQSVAILRKNVVVLWSPSGLPAKGSKKTPAPKIKSLEELAGHRLGVIGTTQANVTLLQVILKESGIDPDKVTVVQFAINQIGEMSHDMSIDAFMSVGPLDSKITSEAIAATARERGEPKFLPIDVSEAIAQKHPLYRVRGDSRQYLSFVAGTAGRQDRNRKRQSSHCRTAGVVRDRGRRIHTAVVQRPAGAAA